MKKIPLTKGYETVVDDEDYLSLSRFNWWVLDCKGTPYARRKRVVDGREVVVMMHREIMGLKQGSRSRVDHIDGNGLNNTRANLRICTIRQNNRNRKVQANSRTGFRGVSLRRAITSPYQVNIGVGKRRKYLGVFSCPVEAAKAYDRAAKRFFGQFARLNFPDAA